MFLNNIILPSSIHFIFFGGLIKDLKIKLQKFKKNTCVLNQQQLNEY